MRLIDSIEKSVKQLRYRIGSQAHNRILSNIMQALDATEKQKSAAIEPNIWRTIMKSPITKLAAAAVIIIAILIGINQFGGSIDGTTVAFADVLENISNAGNVVYKEISDIPNHTFTSVQMVNDKGIIRSELQHGTVLIFDFDNGLSLHLEPQLKEAVRSHQKARESKARGFSYIDWVRKLHQGEAEFDGAEELDGQITNVYVWEVPFEKITVWVDPEINLPVKVEHKTFANMEKNIVMPELFVSMGDFGGDENVSAGGAVGSSRGSGLGISQDTTRTMYDFRWDVELDESLFSLEPPEGYALEERYPDDSPVDDNILVHILGFWAKMRNGQFPTEEQLNNPEAFKPLIIEEYDGDGDPKEEFDQARDEVSRVLKGIYFVQEKKVDGSWGYNGENVLLGQADSIICWWFDEETEGYKAIFGNLSIGDVTEDQLPMEP